MAAVTQHPAVPQPEDPTARTWRYMDFTKYVSILETSSLYFTRADRLGDPYEGSYSKATVQLRPMRYRRLPSPESVVEKIADFSKWVREWTYINCWHMNNYESAAMWKLYAKSNEAIAIQTTYQQLANNLQDHVLIGVVKYLDYDNDILPDSDSLSAFLHKRQSFAHEREIRCIIQDLESPADRDAIYIGTSNTEYGRLVEVKLSALIENVFVAPTSPPWFHALVSGVTEKYGGAWSVRRSSLDGTPVY